MADIRFSLAAAAASLLVAILAGFKGAWAPATVFALLALGFLVRAAQGHRRRGRP
jgi:hypothetical protein